MNKIIRIGMDTSKHIFQLHGVAADERPVLRRKLRRREMIAFFEKLEPTVVGIEACGAAHHWVPDHACRSFFFPGRFAPRLLGGMLSGMSGGGRNCFKVHSPAALVMMLRPTRPRSSLLLDVLKDA